MKCILLIIFLYKIETQFPCDFMNVKLNILPKS